MTRTVAHLRHSARIRLPRVGPRAARHGAVAVTAATVLARWWTVGCWRRARVGTILCRVWVAPTTALTVTRPTTFIGVFCKVHALSNTTRVGGWISHAPPGNLGGAGVLGPYAVHAAPLRASVIFSLRCFRSTTRAMVATLSEAHTL